MSKGKECLKKQTRETIANVFDFLKQDAWEILQIAGNPQYNTEPGVLISKLSDHVNGVRKRTAQAAGVSERTITNILSERRKDSECKTPYGNCKKREKKLELNNFTVEVIRTTVDAYRAEHHKLPSLVYLMKIFKKKLNYNGGVTTLRKVLVEIGYGWGKPKITAQEETIPEITTQKENVVEAIDADKVAETSVTKQSSFKHFFTSNALKVTPNKLD